MMQREFGAGAVTIHATVPMSTPPVWALLERQLIALIDDALDPTLERYVKPDGSVMWPPTPDYVGVDALDDAYESFFNWPLFYLLGGSERYLEASHREFDAITRQYAQYQTGFGHPMVVKEYEQGYDWFHQAEGYTMFYYLCLADPGDERTRERALRFAGFYLNEDPDAVNWDPALRLVKSACTGSMGPAYRNFTGAQFNPYAYFPHLDWAGLPFHDVPGVVRPVDLKDPANAAAMGAAVERRQSHGDVPVNLGITGMLTNAYLYAGDRKYRDWVETYVRAWMERTTRNGGVIPDNVGLSDEIGEYIDGKWYGGYYGWSWPTGWESIGSATTCAGQNALLLSGDAGYLDIARSQLDQLLGRAIEFEGTIHMPTRYGDDGNYELDSIFGALRGTDITAPTAPEGDGPLLRHDGWFDYVPVNPEFPTHLWYMSMSADDQAVIRSTRNHRRPDSDVVVNPTSWRPTVRKNQGGHEQAWLSFLDGEFPDYPEEILRYNLAQVHQRLRFAAQDDQDPSTYGDFYLQQRNPVTVEGLLQLTMGAPMPIYNGGLLMARIRYFDPERSRPGLPPDVAALVRRVSGESLTVELINLSLTESRVVLLRAGAYGEHRFETATSTTPESSDERRSEHFDPAAPPAVIHSTVEVGGPWLLVDVSPGCQTTLELTMTAYANSPSHATAGQATP